jgi:copper chaperone CopZ
VQTAGAGCCAGKAAAATADAKVVDLRTVTYRVSGMKCNVSCVAKVESAVKALKMDGVVDCKVDFDHSKAIVSIDKDVDKDAIQKAIAAVGYEVQYEEAPGDETSTY